MATLWRDWGCRLRPGRKVRSADSGAARKVTFATPRSSFCAVRPIRGLGPLWTLSAGDIEAGVPGRIGAWTGSWGMSVRLYPNVGCCGHPGGESPQSSCRPRG